MSFVGKKFPSIAVKAMNHLGKPYQLNVVEEAIAQNKKVLLFWYPKAFTFVCNSELNAFQEALPEFEKRNTIVIGASCDSAEVQFAWLSTERNKGGIQGVTYPIIADTNRNLASTLGILDATYMYDEKNQVDQLVGDNVAFRATYIITEDGTVFQENINHMPIGRNINEYLRIIDAVTNLQTNGEVCLANWDSQTAKPA